MSPQERENNKITRNDIIKIAVATIIALGVGVLLLVWGPYQENQDLKNKLAVYSRPDQKPPPVAPDDLTASSLKTSFVGTNTSQAMRSAALGSRLKIESLDVKSNQVNLSLSGTMPQVINFDNNLAAYFSFQKDGQARGAGPALAILGYKVLPIATRRGYYQLDITAQPAIVRAPAPAPVP